MKYETQVLSWKNTPSEFHICSYTNTTAWQNDVDGILVQRTLSVVHVTSATF